MYSCYDPIGLLATARAFSFPSPGTSQRSRAAVSATGFVPWDTSYRQAQPLRYELREIPDVYLSILSPSLSPLSPFLRHSRFIYLCVGVFSFFFSIYFPFFFFGLLFLFLFEFVTRARGRDFPHKAPKTRPKARGYRARLTRTELLAHPAVPYVSRDALQIPSEDPTRTRNFRRRGTKIAR